MSKRILKATNLKERIDEIGEKLENNELLRSEEGAECRKLIDYASSLPKLDITDELLTIDDASSLLGCSPQTLRNWDAAGVFVPATHTPKGHRRYTKRQCMELRKQQMREPQICFHDTTANDILVMVQKLFGQFDPMEKINLTITTDSLEGKVKLTVDSVDGLCSFNKSFNIKD